MSKSECLKFSLQITTEIKLNFVHGLSCIFHTESVLWDYLLKYCQLASKAITAFFLIINLWYYRDSFLNVTEVRGWEPN